MGFELESYLARRRAVIEKALAAALPAEDEVPPELARAMRAGVLSGGKRLRPVLALAACQLAASRPARALPAAVAIELVHCGSLVFDDMPCMDDAVERRGRPALHRQFRPGIALQAGDALITLAFELLAAAPWPPETVLAACTRLARTVGPEGMCGGQYRDLAPPDRPVTESDLVEIHQGKTGVLIRTALALGAAAGGGEPALIERLERYGTHLGLAFQVVDDILDAEGAAADLGKDAGRDRELGRATFHSVLGPAGARARAVREVDSAVAALAGLGTRARPLRALARYVLERRS